MSGPDALAVLTLQAGYNTAIVMIGVTLLGAAAGLVGVFALLRKRALMSDVMSHATLPGIGLAFLLAVALGAEGRSLPILLTGAALAGVAGVALVHFASTRTRLPEDAAMGAVLSAFFGLGFVILSYVQTLGTGAEGGIAAFIYGQTAAMSANDALTIGAVALAIVVAATLLFKEFRLVTFDPDFAAVQGWPVSRIDLLMMALVVAVTVVGLQAVGLILVVALVIVPAAAARFWTERLSTMAWLGALFGAASAYVGAALSALLPDFPAGAVIVLSAGALFLASLLLAPRRGVLAGVVRLLRLRLRVETQHLLRAVYEAAEREGAPLTEPVPLADLRVVRRWSAAGRAAVAALLRAKGLARIERGVVRLTPEGAREAWTLTRNHRLWEEYLVRHAGGAPESVDLSADLVEHVLDRGLVARLEESLASRGRLPRFLDMPAGVH